MTDNDIIKALDALLNREYPEDIVPTAVCTVEFLRGAYNIIMGQRDDICYFEDRIDTINYEKNEIIDRQKAEIERLQKEKEDFKNWYEKANFLLTDAYNTAEEVSKNWQFGKHKAIKEFAEEFEKRCIASGVYPVITKNVLKNLVKERTEEKYDEGKGNT